MCLAVCFCSLLVNAPAGKSCECQDGECNWVQFICSALHGLITKIARPDVLPSVERNPATIIDNRTDSIRMTL